MAQRIEYLVTGDDEGMSLGRLARVRMGLSASLLRQIKWLDGGILLDGAPVFVNVMPRAGQVISLMAGREESSPAVIPQQGDVSIVYEDELMLIIDKPGGMAVHPSPGHPMDTLANYLAGEFEGRGEPFVFHAINRLDRGTSGLMCVARTKHSAHLLERALAAGDITREYLAVCQGAPSPAEGTVDMPIGRAAGFGIKRCVDMANGQRAVTHYRVVESRGGRSLVALRLETGRTHQIRVHMAHLGHPLTGDFMYGEELPGFERVALHSCAIRVRLDDREVEMASPLPCELARLLEEGKDNI